jgi:hypothetical protein
MSTIEQQLYYRLPDTAAQTDRSLSGTTIFCGIGLMLILAAAAFGWLGLPAPMF